MLDALLLIDIAQEPKCSFSEREIMRLDTIFQILNVLQDGIYYTERDVAKLEWVNNSRR